MNTVTQQIRAEQQARYAIADKASDMKYPDIRKAVTDLTHLTPAQLDEVNAIMTSRGY